MNSGKCVKLAVAVGIVFCGLSVVAQEARVEKIQANRVAEVTFKSSKPYDNPFMELEVDAVITRPDGKELQVPMFWAGGEKWCLRYASHLVGEHTFRTECSDTDNATLHGIAGTFEVSAYTGNNTLYRHGPIRIASDKRHFEHLDGTPFLWLADTWWKALCKRMTWDGFQELTADREAKGFNAIQIVCGPYPDEEMMEERWGNEGGLPYTKIDFSVVNPEYFVYANRRIEHLVDAGMVPVIVGGWGRPQGGGKSTLMQVGIDGYKRHWRNLVARYAAYPTVWMVGGEAKDAYGPWSKLARYLKDTDPYERLTCYHAPGHPRTALEDNAMFDFDMIAIGHDGMNTINRTFDLMKASFDASPKRPALCGEACYEGHMQTNFQAIQRHMFWSFILSGAAGHTYGAAGIWHAGVEGDAGHTGIKGQEYDFTTWKEGMNYPGSTQIGLGKKLLEKYPWSQFEPHPEWVEADSFAAGIPGEVRFIFLPRRNIYNWTGPEVKNLDPTVDWHAYYFDPATGRTFDQGIIEASTKVGGKTAKPASFKKNVPSPQDWVLVLEKVNSR
jgi:hypothetical protein